MSDTGKVCSACGQPVARVSVSTAAAEYQHRDAADGAACADACGDRTWYPVSTCRWCGRSIAYAGDGLYSWIDPEAAGDDAVWREVCDRHDTFTAEHEPTEAEGGMA